jgi:hypothetical protein
MKKTLALVFAILLLSCSDNDDQTTDSTLTGKWKLTEILMDPGDGSGTFHPVSSNKITEFHSDGTITSNGSICMASGETNFPGSGTYSLADSTIHSADCAKGLPLNTTFKMEGASLIISYPCDEPCREKYIKTGE